MSAPALALPHHVGDHGEPVQCSGPDDCPCDPFAGCCRTKRSQVGTVGTQERIENALNQDRRVRGGNWWPREDRGDAEQF